MYYTTKTYIKYILVYYSRTMLILTGLRTHNDVIAYCGVTYHYTLLVSPRASHG